MRILARRGPAPNKTSRSCRVSRRTLCATPFRHGPLRFIRATGISKSFECIVGHSEVGQGYSREVVSGASLLAPSGGLPEKRQWEKVRYAIQQVIRTFPV